MKITGVFLGARECYPRVVDLFLFRARDPMIFDPAEFAHAGGAKERSQFLLAAFETNVAIEIAIDRIARVTGFRAPDFRVRSTIASEGSGPSGSVTGRKNGALRPWLPKHQPVRIEYEPANIRRLQFCVEAFAVSA